MLVISGCQKPEQTLDPKQYIVVFKKEKVEQIVRDAGAGHIGRDTIQKISGSLESRHNLGSARFTYSRVLHGGVYHLEDEQLARVQSDPDVAYVEKDQPVKLDAVQNNPEWGLDRLDQQDLPLDKKYQNDDAGAVVNVYVIDTGLMASHVELAGRAFSGTDIVDKDADSTDCHGHGTHVAGTIGSLLYGVAKNVKIFGIRVLSCSGGGSNAGVIAGIEWVTQNHAKPAVANMSLGGASSKAVDDAVNASIQAGVTYVVAAGNSNTDACSSSPAAVPAAITVGASTKADARASFSNYGRCLDVFAPGKDIKSLGIKNNSDTDTMSGTSMAAPHVAGVAALYLSRHPNALPAEVSAAIIAGSIEGKISNPGNASPSRLANSLFLGGGAEPQPSEPELKIGEPRSALSGAKGDEKRFVIRVPAGRSKVTVTISGGTGDADLYTRAGLKPTQTSYGCRPYKSGNSESCSVTVSGPADVYLMLRAYSAYTGLKLSAQ